MIDKAVGSFTLLAAPTFMTLAVVRRDWSFVVVLAAWWWLSRAAKMLPHLQRRPSSFFLIPPFVLLSFAMALVKLGALATIRKQRWLTRQVAVVDGEVVRTGPAARVAVGAGAGTDEPWAPAIPPTSGAGGRHARPSAAGVDAR
jgi:hyaluronan synthase